MSNLKRALIVLVVAAAAAGVLVVKNRGNTGGAALLGPQSATDLPRLVDLGAGRCASCKLMQPILVELGENYGDRFIVEYVDVSEDPEASKEYGIRVIPTQIFYDASGKELYRHEGFFGKDDILAKWREFGVVPDAEGS